MTVRRSESLELARIALEGLSVGDAFGRSIQVLGPIINPGHFPATFTDEVRDYPMMQMIEHRGLLPGRWRYTDDTEMALAVFDVLREAGRVDRDALANEFAKRYLADPFRYYGATARHVLMAIGDGVSWREAAGAVHGGHGSEGNGAAMRVAPVGAYFAGDAERAAAEAKASAEVTHQNAEGQAGAIAIAVAVCWAASGAAGDFYDAVLELVPAGRTRIGIEKARRLRSQAIPDDPEVVFRFGGSERWSTMTRNQQELATAVSTLGNGAHPISEQTVPFALWAADRFAADYENAMWGTVAALGDMDTNCAIVGGIVAFTSKRPIPLQWIKKRERLGFNTDNIGEAPSASAVASSRAQGSGFETALKEAWSAEHATAHEAAKTYLETNKG